MEFKVKFDANYIGEVYVTELTATCDYVPNGRGYLKVLISKIEDESTGHTYKYEELEKQDVKALHKAISNAQECIDELMEDARREAKAESQFESNREERE